MGNKSESRKRYWPLFGTDWNGNPTKLSYSSTEAYTRVATDDPMYKTKIRLGVSATNALLTKNQTVYYKPGRMTAQWISRTYSPQLFGKQCGGSVLSLPGSFLPGPISALPNSGFRSSCHNAALVGIIKKIRTYETSDFAGPTFVGELRETLGMIRSPFKSLRLKTGLFTDLHMRILRDKQAKGKRFKPEHWARVLSDTYLEWVFGAAPLISDIASIADLFLEQKAKAFPDKGYKRLSYRFSDDYNTIDTSAKAATLNVSTGLKVSFDVVSHFRSSYQYVAWVDNALVFADTSARSLSSAAKFDFYEIIPTAWELMPWSFLIDYFTNIGDVLGCTFDYSRRTKIVKLTEFNTSTKYHAGFRPYSVEPSVYVPVDFEPWQCTSQYTEVARSAKDELGFPQLDVSLPSLGQASNILALVISLSKSNPFRGHVLT